MNEKKEELKVGDKITYSETATIKIVKGNDIRIEFDSGEEWWVTREDLDI
ncbi:hypothetical protein [Listeria welshimeri]|nr:hypothetical protein [Listeria welshimeri]MBC1342378.1 hypothetical protein [Listeria welshimeri]MBC1705822.1 hypothetical protein [Listeria welshimeri]MBF2342565.1 hypothetical protein [Listeria welshimeri]